MSAEINNRYTPLIKSIMRHTNIVNSVMNNSITLRNDVVLPVQEWMVVELIVEQQEEYNSMVELSRMIGLPPSTFFRKVSHLQKIHLVDKYRVQGNKKNIILRPTELARSIYEEQTPILRNGVWDAFYKELEPLSDSDINIITNAFDKLNGTLPASQFTQELELIKIESGGG